VVRLTRTAIIPVLNEASTIAEIVNRTKSFVDQIIVVDDGSTDRTADNAALEGVIVLSQSTTGYVGALAAGLKAAECDVLITLDGDGEHPIERIPDLVQPIEENSCDVVFGQPRHFLRRTEQLIEWLVARRTSVEGSSSGFRAIRRSYAGELSLTGGCTCGVLAMQLHLAGARLCSMRIELNELNESRSEQWGRHIKQLPRLLRLLLSRRS
jgi:glycosyltransferase involved in cell wall biosynthesis